MGCSPTASGFESTTSLNCSMRSFDGLRSAGSVPLSLPLSQAHLLPLMPPEPSRRRSKNRLNKYFLEHGIGWQMSHGKIVHRGSHAFEEATRRAVEVLGETRQQSAKGEIEEALHDISRRPKPDATGAITHAMAALECVARDATNNPKLTLGQLVPLLNLTQPLDKAVHALWGFSSQRARHIQEGQSVGIAEAELVVFVACALCAFVSGDRK